MNTSLSQFAPEKLVSRDGFGSHALPAQLHTQAESGAYLRDSSRFPRRRPFIYLNRHAPSGLSRVYRVMQLGTDGVRCRESAGTGPVTLKVVPVTGAVFLKKNQSTPRPSEHPPVMGEKNVKTFRWDQRLQIQNLFMAFKQVPRCR